MPHGKATGRRARFAALLLPALLLALVGGAGAEERRARDVYERRRTSIPAVARWVAREARARRVGQVLLVFDAASFAPPPGYTEFSMDRLYTDDLQAWLDAFGNAVSDAGCPFRVTSTLAPKTIDIGDPGWHAEAYALVTRPWWDGDAVQKLEPATKWLGRLLAVTESGIQPGHGDDRRMLVLVGGTITPERWVFLGDRPQWESDWRTRLRERGTYWDEEAIAARLQRDGCVFYAIAPETHFCDFRPYVELPELPWASRPQFPPPRRLASEDAPTVTDPGRFLDEEAMRRALDEQLREAFPDPTERAREVERRLDELRALLGGPSRGGRRGSGLRPRPPTTPGPMPAGDPSSLHGGGLRFDSTTPMWFPRSDGTLLFNNHTPSGYGYWPYARVAAKTGGKYHFYPFPPTRWLDRCPSNPALLDHLAPEMVHSSAYLGRLKNDPALDALARAANLVVEETPWADLGHDDRSATGWGSFLVGSPLRFHADWYLRRKPFEVVFEEPGDAGPGLERTGRRIQEDVLGRYDRAIALLDDAILAEMTRRKKSHPRCVADLYLARYWFSMSAFHLEAFSIYACEIERFIPEDMEGDIERWWVTYVPTIKMSDCLDAYDGRVLAPEDEARYPRWVLSGQPGMQGNILRIDPENPDYRAKRSLGKVLENLDPRLRRRALDMIYAARRVMDDYAKSGWGWSTYYSIAYTFIFRPVPRAVGPRPWRPGAKPPPPPVTPQGPSTTPGGSDPSGPATR